MIWSGIRIETAFRVELIALLLVTVCCFADPPFTSSVEGPVTFEDAADIYIGGTDIFYLDQPVLPDIGATTLVAYQDRVSGQTVMWVTVDPGAPTAVTYFTDAGRRYQQWLWLSYLALFGVLAGLVVAVSAAVRLYVLGRAESAPLRGLSAGIAPFTLLVVPALAANVGSLPASSAVMWVTFAIWPVAAVGTLFASAVGRLDREVELAVARHARTLVWIVGGAGILGWAAYIVWFVIQFATTPVNLPSF
jgi:hypothetical protein